MTAWLAEWGSVAAMILGAGCCGGLIVAVFAGGAAVRNSRGGREQDEIPPPATRVLRDVANPEAYPKTWKYRAARGAEETMEMRRWGP